ncbi:GumC family protein [Larkinella knui]|uniref:GumC family protein n=1 Tax=Larkinella knui TaxID=2025310 RepID=UPI001E296848|nr:lipopolysaccharide biosynthesis protein [Larkinella knui]
MRLLKQHALWFILIPVLTAGSVYYFTKNEPRVYKSQATIYTGLASGYSLLSDQQAGFIDHSAAAFENLLTTLNSKETLRQIGVDLLTRHLPLEKPDGKILSLPAFQELHQAIPESLRLSLVKNADEATLHARIDSLSRSSSDNPVQYLLLKSSAYCSIATIGKKLKATRRSPSDMLDLEYESNDPAVAQQTLSNAIAILNKRYTTLKTAETNSVVNYYEDKAKESKKKLDEAENKLRSFSVEHKLLNFEEESKNVAASRELFSGDYNKELMTNKAVKASMDALNKRMGQQGALLLANGDLKAKQNDLSDAQSQLVNAQAYGQPQNVITRLQTRVDQASEALKTTARTYTAAESSPEAIPQRTLLNEWLEKVIDFEESSARLEVYKSRMGEYQTKTEEYSPLESELRQLNRDLTLAEKDYLASVQYLNQAVTHRQDISVDGALTILDPPNFPYDAQSKRWLFIALGFGIGLFIAMLLTAIRFWIDRRISSPEQAETLIGRPVAAVFPTVRKFSIDSKAGRTALSMFEQLCNAINFEIVKTTATKPYPPVITLFSVRSKQGKTWVANSLGRMYAEAGQQVAYCYPRLTDEQQKVEQEGITFFPYTRRSDLMNVTEIDYLFDEQTKFDASQFDRIILEIPGLISNPIPVYLINQSTVSILVTDVNSIWARTERKLLEMYLKIATHTVVTVLNRVDTSYLDAPSKADVQQRPIQPEHSIEVQRTLRSLENQRTLQYGKLA